MILCVDYKRLRNKIVFLQNNSGRFGMEVHQQPYNRNLFRLEECNGRANAAFPFGVNS